MITVRTPQRSRLTCELVETQSATFWGHPTVVDPVLYVHQGFEGVLPDALMNFEVRTLRDDGVYIQPARMKRILAELNLVY